MLNPLRGIPAEFRPAQHLFIFGNGEMAQLGLGVDMLDEIRRPKLHTWFEEAIEEGRLGGAGAGIEKACTGGMHTLVIDEMGRIWSWGVNDNASLGRLTANVPIPDAPGEFFQTEVLETQPMLVQSLVDEGFRAVTVAAGDSISVALDVDGQLRCWGSFRSSDGLLGFDGRLGSAQQQFTPAPIEDFRKEKFISLACGTDHVLALTTDGRVWVWGNGQQAQLGRKIIERRKTNALRPEKLALKKVVAVGSGSYHSFAIDVKGRVFAWGLNSMKQTGVAAEDGGSEDIITAPTEVRALHPDQLNGEKVIQISGGEHHTLFLVSDGRVYACGRSDGFELGIGPVESLQDVNGDHVMSSEDQSHMRAYVAVPTLVAFPPVPTPEEMNPDVPEGPPAIPPINPVSSVHAGTHHNLAVSRAGYVYSWGTGNQSQLGLGNEEEAERPTRLRYKDGDKWFIRSAGAGGQHCIFLATPK
ncbi:RCC1/BLIP-II [Dacryopinax primogenitus]|uniref:RCC1/BLIP-II n=1 Tax=Dacryopinax primogenitus (strain DJM 731) TaxID=1858805 RepID=M5FNG5_DACPD|nr:RCC1/BLIP-II [Dacryopinax primogenitus]EJT97405.1 RCC1/BLIP-II [Dacryopinax primogenitus]